VVSPVQTPTDAPELVAPLGRQSNGGEQNDERLQILIVPRRGRQQFTLCRVMALRMSYGLAVILGLALGRAADVSALLHTVVTAWPVSKTFSPNPS